MADEGIFEDVRQLALSERGVARFLVQRTNTFLQLEHQREIIIIIMINILQFVKHIGRYNTLEYISRLVYIETLLDSQRSI